MLDHAGSGDVCFATAKRAPDRALAGVVAREHEVVAFRFRNVRPELPQVAVVQDAGSDVPVGLVDRAEFWPVRSDLLVRRRHELHYAARADPARRVGLQLALGESLRLEVAPVESGAEVPFRVFLEGWVEALADFLRRARLGDSLEGVGWRRRGRATLSARRGGEDCQPKPDQRSGAGASVSTRWRARR